MEGGAVKAVDDDDTEARGLGVTGSERKDLTGADLIRCGIDEDPVSSGAETEGVALDGVGDA